MNISKFKLLLASIMLMSATVSFAQKKMFLTEYGKKTKEKYATYYRIITPEGNLFLVKDYYVHNDKLQVEGHYRSKKCEYDTRTGQFTYYYENGEKASEGEFVDGKKDGKWTFWYKDGQLKSEGTLEKGEEEGEWVKYHRNGALKYKRIYKDGSATGDFTTYYDNGDKEETYNYNKGKLDGAFVEYYDNSGNKVNTKGSYAKDSLQGTYEHYWRNGNLASKGEYDDNKRIGIWEYYHSNGNKSAEVEYKKDKFVKATFFDEDGKKLSKKVTEDDLYKDAEYPGGNDKMYEGIYKKLGEKADVAGAKKARYFFLAVGALSLDVDGNIKKIYWSYPSDDDDDYIDRWDFYKFTMSALEDFPKMNPAKYCNRYVESTFKVPVILNFGK